jgi:Tol biopolymer transport system component
MPMAAAGAISREPLGARSGRRPGHRPATIIAYFAASDEGGNIHLMNPDGSGRTNLTREEGRANEYPTWSPDGEWIAYRSYGLEGNIEVFRMRADGSCKRNLTQNGAIDTWPTWSPDGSRIAFISSRDGNRELYVMNPDGTGVTRLTSTPDSTEDFPAWTADGRIAFYRYRSERLHPAELWVADPDGSSPLRLRTNAFATTMSWIPIEPS